MNKKKIRTILCVLLAAAGLTAVGALAAGGAGSQSDPLVTRSYLTETFTGQIMDKVDDAVAGGQGHGAVGGGRTAGNGAAAQLLDQLGVAPGDGVVHLVHEGGGV